MNFWFTTSNGNTVHNQPGTKNYIPGEPPEYPKTKFDYHDECLIKGFARLGYPNTGDLNNSGSGRLAVEGYNFENVYDISNSSETQNQLKRFASILAGDIIVIPSNQGIFWVNFGIVLSKERKKVTPYNPSRPQAYYYFHDIENGDVYECAHRVNVDWAKDAKGDFAVIYVPEIGGAWRKAFSRLVKARERLLSLSKKFGILDL